MYFNSELATSIAYSRQATAQGLEPNISYTLVQFNDPWPGAPAEDLATVMASPAGTVAIPTMDYELDRDLVGESGKMWLVPTTHIDRDGDVMLEFVVAAYLFEYEAIVYDDTDVP